MSERDKTVFLIMWAGGLTLLFLWGHEKTWENQNTIIQRLERLEPRVETVYIQQQQTMPASEPCSTTEPAPGDSICIDWDGDHWAVLEEYLRGEPTP